MSREIHPLRAILNAGLALAVIAMAGYGASLVAARQWRWQKTFAVRVEFARVGGLEPGAKVRIQGMDAGTVEAIVAPSAPGRPVVLRLRVDQTLRGLVRSDASARIESVGIVGGKAVEIVPGQPDAPALPDGATIRAEPTVELADLLRDASAALRRVDAVAEAAEKGLSEITAIASEVRQGRGTLGKLVRDDEAYHRLLALSGRGEKALTDLDENLSAMKNVWPISRYFRGRGFDDRDRVLFHPGSEREARTIAGDDLFEPGRAVLTAGGRHLLDDVASWFLKLKRPRTAEIVVAAFTDTPKDDEELAQALTQEQAEAVRRYLIDRHGIDSLGWFRSRKVAAVGFGTGSPRMIDASPALPDQPPRRVEILVFTPQT